MKRKNYWISWIGMYVLCLIAGFIPEPAGFGKALLILLSLCFFIPGFLLVWDSQCRGDKKTLKRVRLISLSSLILTVLFFIGNILSIFSSDAAGTVLHIFLGIVSVPMFAFQYYLGSLFLWSCLFISTFLKLYRQ